jgi:hypothetical protein
MLCVPHSTDRVVAEANSFNADADWLCMGTVSWNMTPELARGKPKRRESEKA